MLKSISKQELYQTIFKRKSIRKYQKLELSSVQLKDIKDFLKQAQALKAEIKFETKIVDSEQIKSLIPIKAPHYLQFFSETEEDYLLNAGFILEQLDLYLSANNLGCCWYGLAKPKETIKEKSDLEYVITLVFGEAAEKLHRDSVEEFNRKSLAEIKKGENHYDLLEAVRLAPSATNGQPWYFISEAEKLHLYFKDINFIKKIFYQKMNQIDMGIALAHLWLAAEENKKQFNFHQLPKSPAEVEDYNYLGTVNLS